jgi:hypothetical protein
VKKPGLIHVVIGEPIASTGKNPRQLTDEVRRAVDAGLAKIAAT